MSNQQTPDGLDLNIKLFFERFVNAVESKNEQELNILISDEYKSPNLMNKNKRELISFILKNLPEIPLLKFKLKVTFYQVDYNKERDAHYVTIKPNYTYKFLWLNLITGIFGRAETVCVTLEKHPDTDYYWIVGMEDAENIKYSKDAAKRV